MSSISQNNSNEVALLDCVQKFFIKHHVGRLLKQCNGTKEKGVSAVSLLKYKMGNIFTGRSMYMQQKTGSFKEAFSKNTFYRFLNSTKTNWLRFTSLLAADIVKNDLKHLTDDSRKNVFIIDDSLFHRTSCKKTELGSKVFDHTGMNYKKGFRMLTVSWSDGNTLIPVNSCLLASSKESNIIGPVKAFDKRTLAGKRRKLAQTKAPEAMLTLLDTAVSAGLSAEYVLFDSWFSNPAQITALKSRGMDVIAMIKKSSRIKYTYGEDQLNIKEIYSRNKKRRGRSRYLLSVDVMVGKENPIPAKIVCVRNKANRKDWLAFICTDTSLSEEEIIRIYGKRWKIEVFFKTCKPWIPVSDNFEKINVKKQKQDRDSILEFYKKLIMLRKEKEVIARGNIEFMEVENAGVLAYTRCLDKQKLLVCCNFRDVESQMEFTQEWKSGRKILGNYEENHKNNYKVLTLRPYEIIVLEKGEE